MRNEEQQLMHLEIDHLAKNPWFGVAMRVRYQETDAMAVVFHGNVATWFEVGRTEWIRALGVDYKQLEAEGLLFPVTDLRISYKRPAHYDDWVAVFTRLDQLGTIRMSFQSVVCRLNEEQVAQVQTAGWSPEPIGELLYEGGTDHAWIGRDWRPKRVSREQPELWSMLQQLVQKKMEA
ncbi:acyl-CoA thioesterase [Paenibacillus assamensis]|uniref:acyl-CoA thioesterase n=1 Tax=Paenibacillus assamensis TaxID=311244 RepID=UPI0003F5242B|nr:thioesterase family protein [Paenibacillus assamensis]